MLPSKNTNVTPQEKLATSNLASEDDVEGLLCNGLLVYGKYTNVQVKLPTLHLPTEAEFESFLCNGLLVCGE